MARLIDLWDPLARRLMGIRTVAEGSVVGYAIRRYPRSSLSDGHGATVQKGEPVIELHLDSRQIQAKTAGATAHQRILFLRREVLAALRLLAQQLKTDPDLNRTRGVWAFSFIHRGVEFLGFTVIDVEPSPFRSLTARYLRWLLASYHPDGDGRLEQREEELVPKEIFLSKERLLALYGAERRRERQPKAEPAE